MENDPTEPLPPDGPDDFGGEALMYGGPPMVDDPEVKNWDVVVAPEVERLVLLFPEPVMLRAGDKVPFDGWSIDAQKRLLFLCDVRVETAMGQVWYPQGPVRIACVRLVRSDQAEGPARPPAIALPVAPPCPPGQRLHLFLNECLPWDEQ